MEVLGFGKLRIVDDDVFPVIELSSGPGRMGLSGYASARGDILFGIIAEGLRRVIALEGLSCRPVACAVSV